MTISKITSDLYVGNLRTTRDEPLELLYDITHVVSIQPESISHDIGSDIEYSHYPMRDGPHDYNVFEASVDAIRDAWKSNGTVLVHCHAGASRSVCAAAAALSTESDRTLSEALNLINNRREIIAPTEELARSAHQYAHEHQGEVPANSSK